MKKTARHTKSSDSREEQHLRDLAWQRQHSECSSFAMAHCYPDYAGEVDVVSEAENIKRLLKIPYDNSHASLIVHRVGRTLLLDNFDIHKHLLRQESENWTWLREFFKNTVVKNEDEMKYVPRQVKSQAVLQKRLMFSKFLYKSLVGHSGQEVEVSQADLRHVSPSTSPSPVVQHFVADHLPAIDQVKLGEEGEFRREMLWTFEHLRMLIGTDLPVFSVGDHPCVSVRLRDSSQPINVVTGLDYWLDNLMCNVPEVAMCYHDGGFVQKYELIKTEDIPKLPNSGFNTHEVKDIATNILSFLRNSATKEGHTYWLYKCNRSDVVKLYDLTTLCDKSLPNQGSNPFTIPVAMLLYRVGRKMHLAGRSPGQVPQIKALLHTCLQLLDETEHAEVCTSSYYLLSDLYIPDSCIRNVWIEDQPEDPSSEEEGEEERSEFSVSVKDLMAAPRGNLQAPRRVNLEGITGTPDERCKDGLQCIRKGLSCLGRDLQMKTLQSQRSNSNIVEEQRTCKSSEAIPLRYEPLRPAATAPEAPQSTMLIQRSSVWPGGMGDSWHKLSKALLLRKAAMANYVLASEFLANKQPGMALKHIRYALHCFESMACLKPSKEADQMLLMLILKTTSEVRHLLATGGGCEEQQRGYDDMSEEDAFILDSAQSVLPEPELGWVYKWTTNRRENLGLALRCLEALRDTARRQSQTSTVRDLMGDVTKKMGALCNELGKISMTQAETLLKDGAAFGDLESAWTSSLNHFGQGLQCFHKVKDSKNETIVMLNITRLHRIAFHAYKNVKDEQEDVIRAMRRHIEDACDHFRSALQRVEHGQTQLRNNILWDFSSTYLGFGFHLQHNPPPAMDKHKVLTEVGEMYRKGMKQCQKIEAEVGESLWFCCKDRLASLDYNLAEMHVASYCLQLTQGRANKVFSQADGCYRRAVELFLQARMHYKMLQVQCKRIAFYFHHCSDKDVAEMPDVILGLFTECHQSLQEVQACGDVGTLDTLPGDAESPQVLLEYLLKPVLSACQQLLKRATKSKKMEELPALKETYRRSLELQNAMKDRGATLQHKFHRMADFTAYLCHHADHPPSPQSLVS
ncbi:erythroid differentiation-related factor 1-like isoform X2 [Babylonia areolata]|uniref:erythroid differentiation-related factor 1-like isoform X2 n=1 Tax=Babylonia areolata TaxID=304850 RepID=UPI003FD0FF46